MYYHKYLHYLLVLLLLLVLARESHQECYNSLIGDESWIVSDGPSKLTYSCGLKANRAAFGNNSIIALSISNSGCPSECNGKAVSCAEIAAPKGIQYIVWRLITSFSLLAWALSMHNETPRDWRYWYVELWYCAYSVLAVSTCMVASTTATKYEEIYVKFFGNDTTRVFIGYYTNGRAYQAGPVKLSFRANEGYHKYAFEWTTTSIKWLVDGKEVSSEWGNRPLPTTPNRFMVSLLTEFKGNRTTDNTLVYTEANVNRNFVYVCTLQLTY